MKKKIKVFNGKQYIDKELNYIPTRYIMAILITLLEILTIIAVMVLLILYVPYFYILFFATEIISIVTIVVSYGNPDYKVTWLFFVVMLPLVGLMLFLIFHKRKLPKKAIKRLNKCWDSYDYNDDENMESFKKKEPLISTQVTALTHMSNSHLYKNTNLRYYSLGEKMQFDMIEAIKNAENFIFLEYFIIEEGVFWQSILDTLIEKVKQGVEVKLVYDDIGCMGTLPGNYYKVLRKKYNIDTVLFSKLKGQANGEFNNRSHRKLLIIDGKVCFTGGINIADEYINKENRVGHWKDVGVRLEGLAVNEFTKLFLTDFYINKKNKEIIDFNKYYVTTHEKKKDNYVVPFGDGPRPIFKYNVGKMAIINLLQQAQRYVYITTPYLVVDNELMSAIANTAMRGVDIRIVVPHIPDKKFVFNITKCNYRELIKSGVKIYEYTPGFIHAKTYIADDQCGIIGTINLDYRSLAHHFENGVWVYDKELISQIREDLEGVFSKSEYMNEKPSKDSVFTRLFNVILKLFAPLL